MKKLIFITTILLLLVSCRNYEDTKPSRVPFVGTWNWVSTTGGVGNINETPQNTGKSSSIIFTMDLTYQIFENGLLVNEGTYKLHTFTTFSDHSQRVYIELSDYEDRIVKKITSTDLYIYEDLVDGLEFHYKK